MLSQESNQYRKYFDDLWVYRLGEENRESCVWAIDMQENTCTPLPLDFSVSSSTVSSSNRAVLELRLKNSGHTWVFRKKISRSECELYFTLIMKLQTHCENANWKRGPIYTENNPLKLSQLL